MDSSPRLVRLLSGVSIVPRGDGLVQVGTDPDRRVLLPDTTSIGLLLNQFRTGRLEEHTSTSPVLQALDSAGLVVDVADRMLLTEAKAHTRITLQTPDPWRPLAEELLCEGGLGLAKPGRAGDVDLVVTLGEPSREEHDQILAADHPALFVSVLDARVRVGPFVLPGSTACLRCMDARLQQQDPGHRPTPPQSVQSVQAVQAVQASPEPGPIGPHPDLAPLLLRQALLSATADLCAWAEGRQPRSWSTSLWYDERLGLEEQRWPRHPHCGCCWGETLTG